MAKVWVRKRGEPEHAEIKLSVDRYGHVSDVLTRSAEVLRFDGQRVQAGGLQAETPDGRPLSNKEQVGPYDGRTLVISERGFTAGSAAAPPPAHSSAPAPAYLPSLPSPPAGHSQPPYARSGSGGASHHYAYSDASSYKAVGHQGGGGHPQPNLPPGKHVCAGCGNQILGLKVVLTLPGSPTSVDLHPECEVQFERSHALSCSYCTDLILDRLTTLTGDFGTINLHPQCVDPYKRAAGPGVGPGMPNSVQVASGGGFTTNGPGGPSLGMGQQQQQMVMAGGGGGGGAYTCSLCRNTIEGTKVSLKLPGFNHKVDLHPQCEYTYAVNNALRCDHCSQPMLDGITVLTGNFGDSRSKQLHPSCVPAFKQAQSGHGRGPVAWPDQPYVPSNTQWKPVAGSPSANYGGGVRWGPQQSTS